MVELVDSDTDSDDESIEEVAVEKPMAVQESPPAAAASPRSASPASAESSEEAARRIKEQFRCSMARVMVQHLNPYRHPEAPAARITCTADFKHLARKVTHLHLYHHIHIGVDSKRHNIVARLHIERIYVYIIKYAMFTCV